MGCGLSWLGQNPGSPLCCLSTGTTAPATAGAKLTVDSSRHPPVPCMLLPLRIQPHSVQHRPPGGLPVSTSHQPNNAFKLEPEQRDPLLTSNPSAKCLWDSQAYQAPQTHVPELNAGPSLQACSPVLPALCLGERRPPPVVQGPMFGCPPPTSHPSQRSRSPADPASLTPLESHLRRCLPFPWQLSAAVLSPGSGLRVWGISVLLRGHSLGST